MLKGYIDLREYCTRKEYNYDAMVKLCKAQKLVLLRFGPTYYVDQTILEAAILTYFQKKLVNSAKRKKIDLSTLNKSDDKPN